MKQKRSGLKRTGSQIVFGLISVVILLWTSYLTTSFLSMVLPSSFWVVPYLGLVVFDGGMIGWMFVYLYLAEGSMQRSIALGLTVFNLIGVGLMTIAEIVLGGQTLTEVPAMLGTVAIWAELSGNHSRLWPGKVAVKPSVQRRMIGAVTRAFAVITSPLS